MAGGEWMAHRDPVFLDQRLEPRDGAIVRVHHQLSQ